MRASIPTLLFASLLTASGCSDRTALRLVIRSNLSVPGELDEVVIRMASSTGASAPPRRLVLATNSFPQTLVVRPETSGMSGVVTFTVQGLNDGPIVIQRVVRAPFRAGQVVDVDVELGEDCLGVQCGDGIDCLRGRCDYSNVDVGMPDAIAFDAGSDAATDASGDVPMDAGSDVGPSDAWSVPPDSPPDVPRDVPPAVDTGIGCVGVDCVGTVVISEFATTFGATGGLDEFIELYNAGDRVADISGLRLYYRSASGGTSDLRVVFLPGSRIPARSYFLAVSSGYTGSVTPDVAARWSTGFANTGGSISLQDDTSILVDRVCWGTAVSSICDGNPIGWDPGTMTGAQHPVSGSFERKASMTSTATTMSAGGADQTAGNGFDSGDNSVDFIQRSMRDPQNSMSSREPL